MQYEVSGAGNDDGTELLLSLKLTPKFDPDPDPIPDQPHPGGRLTRDHIEYRGAFRFPREGVDFRIGSRGCYPHGGVLYVVNRKQETVGISIPSPVNSRSQDDLTQSIVIEDPIDALHGHRNTFAGWKVGETGWVIGGVAVTNRRSWHTVHHGYNVAGSDDATHFEGDDLFSEDGLKLPPYRLECGPAFPDQPNHGEKHNGYICRIPQPWAKDNLSWDGIVLASGRTRSSGSVGSSRGPCMFFFQPEHFDGPEGPSYRAKPGFYYPYDQGLPGHKPADGWVSAVFVQASDGAAGILYFGHRGLGEHYYAPPKPGHSGSKGYHADPYQPQCLFYDPAEAVEVSRGERDPWSVLPYDRVGLATPPTHTDAKDADGDLIPYEPIEDPAPLAWGEVCYQVTTEMLLYGSGYDHESRRIYVVQYPGERLDQFTSFPVVHVFGVR